jgi:hypothetical protein
MHTTFTLFYVYILFHTLLSFWQPFVSMECIYVSAMIYVCFVPHLSVIGLLEVLQKRNLPPS